MAKLRMAHASTHGARKPPGPIWDPKKIGTKIFGVKKLGPGKNLVAKKIQTQRQFDHKENFPLYLKNQT